MTPEEISGHYWSGKIIDDTIVWTHPNITVFFDEHGLKMDQVTPFIGSIEFKGRCGTCGKEGLPFAATSRSKIVALYKRVQAGNGRCTECFDKEQEQAVLAAKLAAEKVAAEKAAELETYRKSLVLKHGVLMTGELCPECDGFLIARLNSTSMKPFLSCSRFNPYRWSCDYTQSLAPEFHDQFMPIFRARLLNSGFVPTLAESGSHAA